MAVTIGPIGWVVRSRGSRVKARDPKTGQKKRVAVIELLMSKCVPVLYYGSECCPVSKRQFNSLEFALCGSFMKIFNTRSKEIGNYTVCMEMFNVQTPPCAITKRKCKFFLT